jgi:hypothetical protein
VVCPQPRLQASLSVAPVLSSRPPKLTRKPPSTQSPFAQGRCCLPWGDVVRLLRGHYSPFFAPTDSCANPVGSPFLRFATSVQESWQVATSPCCQRHLPDSISANLSPDAWPPAPTVPPSAFTCFFLDVIGLPQDTMGRLPVLPANATFPRFSFRGCRHFFMFRPLSSLASQIAPTATSFPAGRPRLLHPGISCFVASARSGYAIRPIQVIDRKGLSPFKIYSLVGCSSASLIDP